MTLIRPVRALMVALLLGCSLVAVTPLAASAEMTTLAAQK